MTSRSSLVYRIYLIFLLQRFLSGSIDNSRIDAQNTISEQDTGKNCFLSSPLVSCLFRSFTVLIHFLKSIRRTLSEQDEDGAVTAAEMMQQAAVSKVDRYGDVGIRQGTRWHCCRHDATTNTLSNDTDSFTS